MKSVLLATTSLIVGIGVGIGASLHAATGPGVYTVYEANVTDEAAYTKALPDVEKVIKENTGVRVAGGFQQGQADRRQDTGRQPLRDHQMGQRGGLCESRGRRHQGVAHEECTCRLPPDHGGGHRSVNLNPLINRPSV